MIHFWPWETFLLYFVKFMNYFNLIHESTKNVWHGKSQIRIWWIWIFPLVLFSGFDCQKVQQKKVIFPIWIFPGGAKKFPHLFYLTFLLRPGKFIMKISQFFFALFERQSSNAERAGKFKYTKFRSKYQHFMHSLCFHASMDSTSWIPWSTRGKSLTVKNGSFFSSWWKSRFMDHFPVAVAYGKMIAVARKLLA